MRNQTSRMHGVVKIAVAMTALLGGAAARADWMDKIETNPGNLGQVAQWINSACKPDSLDDIKVVSYQDGRGGKISVHVFCNRGKGKLKALAYDFWKYQRDIDLQDFVQNVLEGNANVVVLLREEGNENKVHYLH